MYGIGKESEDEYVIKLDNSTCCSWLEVLQNSQQMEWLLKGKGKGWKMKWMIFYLNVYCNEIHPKLSKYTKK